MKVTFVVLLALVAALLRPSEGRKFTKCELLPILLDEGFPLEEISDWLCVIQTESSYNSSAIGGPNTNGSFDYGLFQINENYWCDDGGLSNDCNIDCKDLLDDNLSDDLQCVKKIYARHGFSAWNGWKKWCQGAKPSFTECLSIGCRPLK
ncbi:lysozyme c-1-like [Phlebotomus argentipes]|uniref:lysozyme c-1-like n=1 Tax=Phlebotomus argentipes TaxID=94469 RepID=UPI0028930CFF|nr:lysozyme c-1-like [Phlebotomus argentipes]